MDRARSSAPGERVTARTLDATRPATRVVVGLALALGWALALHKIGRDDVYAYLGPYAVFTLLVASLLIDWRHARLSEHVGKDLALGVGVGVVMTLGTYAAFAVLHRLMPSLESEVAALYTASRTQRPGPAIAWTMVILVTEELVWRELLLRPSHARIALSLGTYVLVQVGSGSWITALAAFVCGAIWTTERLFSRSIVAPIVSHAIWTLTVIHLYPVTG